METGSSSPEKSENPVLGMSKHVRPIEEDPALYEHGHPKVRETDIMCIASF